MLGLTGGIDFLEDLGGWDIWESSGLYYKGICEAKSARRSVCKDKHSSFKRLIPRETIQNSILIKQ